MPYPNEHACRLRQFEAAAANKEAKLEAYKLVTNKPILLEETYAWELLAIVDAMELFEFNARPAPEIKVVDDVGEIPIYGILSNRLTLWQLIFGGITTIEIEELFQSALENPAVNRIVLKIDSPGGEVSGIEALAEKIYQARKIKLITALIADTATSAAYWIASAAEAIVMASNTSVAGSIGVVAIHRDFSEAEKRMGIKTTEIIAGRYKRINSRFQPLTEEGKAKLQEQVDEIYRVFVNSVARNRNVSPERVIERMAEGRVFIGQKALEAGLVDEIALNFPGYRDNNKQTSLTKEYLAENAPKLFAEIEKAGIEKERARIREILALGRQKVYEGFSEIISEAIDDGKTLIDTKVALADAIADRGITISQMKEESIVASFQAPIEDNELESTARYIAEAANRRKK